MAATYTNQNGQTGLRWQKGNGNWNKVYIPQKRWTSIKHLFYKSPLPKVSPDDSQLLGAPLKHSEIKEAICSCAAANDWAPDSYPVEFFKQFSDLLAPILLEMFNNSCHLGTLPPTLMQALIALIHEKV